MMAISMAASILRAPPPSTRRRGWIRENPWYGADQAAGGRAMRRGATGRMMLPILPRRSLALTTGVRADFGNERVCPTSLASLAGMLKPHALRMDIPSNGAANCLLLHKKACHQAPPGATPSKRTSARAQLKPQEPRNSKRGRAICGTVRERNHDIPRCITRRRQPNAERPRPLRPARARAPAGAHPNTHSKERHAEPSKNAT